MSINILDGLLKDYSSMNVCFTFNIVDNNLHVLINEYEETYEEPNTTNSFAIFPIYGTSSSIELESDISLKDTDGEELGTVCIPDKNKLMTLSELTLPMLICLIIDYSLTTDIDVDQEVFSSLIDFGMSNEYLINSSCVLIKADSASIYESKYKDSSAIWGGFTHDDLATSHKKSIEEIYVIDNIALPTSEHRTKLSESIFASNGFDRFLKKYHLLELLYDYICVAKLRTVGNGFIEYRDIMGEYSKDDITNLKNMITSNVNDIDQLCEVIRSSSQYKDQMNTIFQIHSKSSNPLQDETNWDKFWSAIEANKLTELGTAHKDYKFYGKKTFKFGILTICSYWIYRIRCSIAHNKIGEFMFSSSDEEFVVEFGEAIIDIVSAQIFSNPELLCLLKKSKQIDEFLQA